MFTGHVHKGFPTPYEDPINHTLIFQNYGNGTNIGQVNFYIHKKTKTLAGYDFAVDRSAIITLLEDEFWVIQGIRIATLLAIAVSLFLIGELARYKLGRWFIRIAEWAVLKLPILRTVYTTCHQIGEAIWAPSGNMFRKVVLFEYPRKGIYVIGFMTNDNSKGNELTSCTGKQLISIFLPTTPNPTSGFLLFIPAEECTILDMKISDAMRLIISGGAIDINDTTTIND